MAKNTTSTTSVDDTTGDAELVQILADAKKAGDAFDAGFNAKAQELEAAIAEETTQSKKTDKAINADMTTALEEISAAQAKIVIADPK